MTYKPDFSGCWSKLDRAEQHRQVLEGELVLRWENGQLVAPETNRVAIRMDYDAESGHHVFRATDSPPEDSLVRWGLVVGDAIHNLRSALDHLTWQLALAYREGWEPRRPNKVQFPITDEPLPGDVPPEDFAITDPSGRPGMLAEVAPEHRAMIYRHQPHGAMPYFGFGGGFHPLVRLRKFSNTDKHRVVAPVYVVGHVTTWRSVLTGAESVEYLPAEDPFAWLHEPGAEIERARVGPASFQRNVEVAGYIAPGVSFREVDPKGGEYFPPVTVVLMGIEFKVAEIVRAIEDCF